LGNDPVGYGLQIVEIIGRGGGFLEAAGGMEAHDAAICDGGEADEALCEAALEVAVGGEFIDLGALGVILGAEGGEFRLKVPDFVSGGLHLVLEVNVAKSGCAEEEGGDDPANERGDRNGIGVFAAIHVVDMGG
jgi:hypothetical protein